MCLELPAVPTRPPGHHESRTNDPYQSADLAQVPGPNQPEFADMQCEREWAVIRNKTGRPVAMAWISRRATPACYPVHLRKRYRGTEDHVHV
jgi:hypothetical protein